MLVLAVWFTCRSSTGSRKVASLARQHPTCAAPATVKRTSSLAPLLSHKPLDALNKRLGRRQRLSPSARIPANKVAVRLKTCRLNAQALSGKAVRAHNCWFSIMKKSIRARGFVPALSLLSLAVAASVHAQVIEINPVVVSASRAEQPLSEVLSSVSVITRQDIEKSQAPTLADLLLGEAGFEFGRNGGPGATTSFFLRGQDSTNVVIMVDGVRSQADAIGALTMTDMPLAQIERIEILRGNAGALYGESAIGGVINIFTRKGKGVPRAYGALTYGSRNTSEMNAGYGGSIADYSFDFNAGITKTDGFSSMNPSQNTAINPERDGYSNRFASVKVDKKINSDLTLGVRANIKNSKTDFDNDSFGSGRQSDTHQFKITSDLVGVSARQAVTDAWVSSLDFSGSNFSYENIKNGAKIIETEPIF